MSDIPNTGRDVSRPRRDIRMEKHVPSTLRYLRIAWVWSWIGVGNRQPDKHDPDLVFHRVWLKIRLSQREVVRLTLTDFTCNELESLWSLIDEAFTLARPIVEAKDRLVNDDDENAPARVPLSRKYRIIPETYRAPWARGEHGEGIWNRFTDASGMGEEGFDLEE